MSGNRVAVILLAAGSSRRMNGVDKLWVDLAGEPLLARSLRELARVGGVDDLIVVAPADRHAAIAELARGGAEPVRCVTGGVRRQDSVAAGLAATPDANWYLVHDAARPLVTAALAARVLEAARVRGAAIPGVAPADTVKRVDEHGQVCETLDRDSLRLIQTPQAFSGELLRRAHREIAEDVTDDAAMIERLGRPVTVVEGDPLNRKVTTAADLEAARALIAAREAATR